ncbi:ATPase assembly factor ATP10 [Gracilaria domingensis]|nr:ATPase assembly factor ATP10 [Gracilaria domingensis]
MWRSSLLRLSPQLLRLNRLLAASSRRRAALPYVSQSITRNFVADQGAKGHETPPRSRRLADDIKEYNEATSSGRLARFDSSLIPIAEAAVFPRIKTTSLSTKRIVIHDEASHVPVTLVLVAFRSFADDQLASWRETFTHHFPQGRWFDVTINESFGAQALSGFVQRWQRGRTDQALHDYYVSFNDRAREPLESLLLSRNRMYGYVLLLDRKARVRFRGSGMANPAAIDALLESGKQLITEDNAEIESF